MIAQGRRTLAVLGVAAAAALAAAGSGHAGGGTGGSGHWICGPRGSVEIPDSIAGQIPFWRDSGPHVQKAAPAAPQVFYRVSYGNTPACAVNPQIGTAYFIPAAGDLRTVDSISSQHALWAKLSSKLADRLRALVHDIKPYAAPSKVPQATVGDQFASRPSSYLRLYTIGTPTRTAPSGTHWTGIWLSGAASPWTDGKNVLSVSKRGDYLKRDGQIVRIAAAPATLIRRAAPIPK